NTLQARFPGGATQIQLQTGTVAGAILVTPSFAVNSINLTPANPATLRLDVAKAAPVLLSGSIPARTNTAFTISVDGYTTTRSLTTANFTFTGINGETLGQSSIDLSGSSKIWFGSASSNASGGQFSIQVPFTLSTQASTTDLVALVKSVTVTVV